MRHYVPALLLGACLSSPALADKELVVPIHRVDTSGTTEALGTITLRDSDQGLVLTPDLSGLPPGGYGFHVHEHPSCAPDEQNGETVAALAAGSHFDPKGAGAHGKPWGEGHKGDLPLLTVNGEGKASTPVLAPRLSLDEVRQRSLMIHAGGDNYADDPEPLGGGGARMACGVIPG